MVLQLIPTPMFNLINALRNYSAASVMLTACVALKLLPTPMVYLKMLQLIKYIITISWLLGVEWNQCPPFVKLLVSSNNLCHTILLPVGGGNTRCCSSTLRGANFKSTFFRSKPNVWRVRSWNVRSVNIDKPETRARIDNFSYSRFCQNASSSSP